MTVCLNKEGEKIYEILGNGQSTVHIGSQVLTPKSHGLIHAIATVESMKVGVYHFTQTLQENRQTTTLFTTVIFVVKNYNDYNDMSEVSSLVVRSQVLCPHYDMDVYRATLFGGET
jgi:hypothetical protein